jgi:hypothetical protein
MGAARYTPAAAAIQRHALGIKFSVTASANDLLRRELESLSSIQRLPHHPAAE